MPEQDACEATRVLFDHPEARYPIALFMDRLAQLNSLISTRLLLISISAGALPPSSLTTASA